MKPMLLILALITFFCTCGRAQNIKGEPLKFENASIAFIKSSNSGPIDSITISTSIDKVPYGRFKWLHGMHVPNKKIPSLAKWAIFPNSTYLLVDKKFKLIGAYPNLQRMAEGVWWHTNKP